MKLISIPKFPLFIKWNMTSECNLRCKHCFISNYEATPSYDDIESLINELDGKGVVGISITGGEPLLRDDLIKIVRQITSKEIKLSIATNGVLINESNAKELVENGVGVFQVSLDGATNKVHDYIRGNGTFSKAINGIKLLKDLNANVIIAFTINKFNYKEIDLMIDLANKLDCRLRFELFLPIGSGLKEKEFFNLNGKTLEKVKEKLLFVNDENKNIEIPLFSSIYGCGAGVFNCVINSDLSLSPCDMLIESEKTKTIKNVKQFEDEWNNSKIFVKWRNIKVDDEICENCNEKDTCNYGCRASAIAYGNGFYGVDEMCLYRG